MKKLLILLTIFFQMQLSHGQSYRPFLQDSAHWIMTTHYCECDIANPQPTDCWVQTTYSYKLGGTDTLNGIAYRQLTQSILRIVNPNPSMYCGFSSFTPCQVVALLREDTLAKKVYVASGWCSQDSLLYDFSMQVGDSMKFNASCPVSGTPDSFYVVDSIGYTPYLQGNPTIKTWYLHDIDSNSDFVNLKLYESVGTSVGFWGYQLNFDEGQLENSLVEYCIGSDSACGFSCMDPLLGITSPSSQSISASIYPNPAKDNLTIDLMNMAPDENLQFVITDILGQELHSQTIINAKSEIDISAFSSGIYLWHLLSDGNILRSGKVVHD